MMSFFSAACKWTTHHTIWRRLGSWTKVPSIWPQNFHTSQRRSSGEDVDVDATSKSETPDQNNPNDLTRGKKKRWSAADEGLLLQLHREGRSALEMSAVLRKSKYSIKGKRKRLIYDTNLDEKLRNAQKEGLSWQQLQEDMPLHTIGHLRARHATLNRATPAAFTLQEDEQIRDLTAQPITYKQMAEMMGGKRSPMSIARRFRMLVQRGLAANSKHWSGHIWSESEEQELRSLIDMGKSRTEMSQIMEKSMGSINGKIYRLSCSSSSSRNGRKWTRDDYELLKSLLAEGKTHREIGKKMGRTLDSIRQALRRSKGLEESVGGEK